MDELLVKIESNILLDWIKEGLLRVKIAKKATKSQKDTLILSLPEKYRRIIQEDLPLPLLIDDVRWISAASEKQTLEMAAKYANLGEDWLPFQFHAAVKNQEVINLVKLEAKPDTPKSKTQSAKSKRGNSSENQKTLLPEGTTEDLTPRSEYNDAK